MQPGDDAKVAKRAAPASHGALTNCSTLPAVSLFKTREEVSLSPAMTTISYELPGHPVRESYTFTPLRTRAAGNYSYWPPASSRLSVVGGAGNGVLPRSL